MPVILYKIFLLFSEHKKNSMMCFSSKMILCPSVLKGSGILFMPTENIGGHCIPIFTYLEQGGSVYFVRLQHIVSVFLQTVTFSAKSP